MTRPMQPQDALVSCSQKRPFQCMALANPSLEAHVSVILRPSTNAQLDISFFVRIFPCGVASDLSSPCSAVHLEVSTRLQRKKRRPRNAARQAKCRIPFTPCKRCLTVPGPASACPIHPPSHPPFGVIAGPAAFVMQPLSPHHSRDVSSPCANSGGPAHAGMLQSRSPQSPGKLTVIQGKGAIGKPQF